jgi:uncharacterized protein YndB with AHSA1/START domain/DNA-binding transcriptional ArsR family regulator
MLKQCGPTDHEVDVLFQALADTSRRAMVDRLTRGPASVSELARPLAMSLPAVVQHLHVLEASGLVRSQKLGRVRTCSIEPAALRAAERWVTDRRTAWERSLDRLGEYLAEQPHPPAAREHTVSQTEQAVSERSTVHSTFVIERIYAASPQRVFDAWADPAAKAQWFGPPEKPEGSYSLDFREGGREHLAIPTPDNGPVYTFDAVYQDIVPGQRIVYAYDMHCDGDRISVSLATVEIEADGAARA